LLGIAASLAVPLSINLFYWIQPESYPWLGAAIFAISLLGVLALALDGRGAPGAGAWLGAGTALLAFLVYLRTLSPTTDVADSFEFQAVAHQLRFAHRPGYPLYVSLGKLFTLLPAGDIAYRMNLYSAAAAAAAAGVLCLTAARLTGRPGAAIAAALTFAFSPAFWSQAVITEVYALNALIVAALLYALVRWTEPETRGSGGRRPLRWLGVAVLAFALGAMHHVTIVFFAPVLLGAVVATDWRTLARPRSIARLAAAFALGLTPLLYFFVRWPKVFGRPIGPWEVLQYVTARSYTGLYLADWPLRDPSRLLMYRHELGRQFGAAALAMAALGLLWLARRRPQWVLWLALAYGLYVTFRLGYNAWDGWVVLTPAHMVVALALAAGLAALADLVAALPGPAVWARAGRPVGWTLTLLLPVAQLWSNGPASDRSAGWPAAALGRQALATDLPPRAWIVLAPGLGSAIFYPHMLGGVRPDVRPRYVDTSEGRRLMAGQAPDDAPIYVFGLDPPPDRFHLRSLGPLVELGRTPRYAAGAIPRPVPAPVLDPAGELEVLGYGIAAVETGPLAQSGAVASSPSAGHGASDALPGQTLGVTLHWRVRAEPEEVPNVALRLARRDAPPAGTSLAAPVFARGRLTAGEAIADYHTLGVDVAARPGVYDLEIALVAPGAAGTGAATAASAATTAGATAASAATTAPGGMARDVPASADWRAIGTVRIGPAPPDLAARAAHPVRADWSGRAALLGYDAPRAVRAGDPIELVLYWSLGRLGSVVPDGTGADDTEANETGAGGTGAGGTGAEHVGTDQSVADRAGTDRAAAAPGVVIEIDAGAAGKDEVVFPAVGDSESLVGATRHTLRVPRDAAAGPLPVAVRVLDGATGRPLPYRPAKSLWSREGALALPSIVVRTALDGLDAPVAFADGLRLVGFRAPRIVRPGERLLVPLDWEAYAPPRRRVKVSLQLLDARGERLAGDDREILHGTLPTDAWRQGEHIADVMPLDLPPDLPPGGYQLQLAAYDQTSRERLAVLGPGGRPVDDRWLWGMYAPPIAPPALSPAAGVRFGDALALLGYGFGREGSDGVIAPGRPLSVRLRWSALVPPARDYTLFVHLLRVDAAGGETLAAQWDGQPWGGAFPTGLWPAGQPIDLEVTLAVPPVEPGDGGEGEVGRSYRLAVGWYDLATGRRLRREGAGIGEAGDRFDLEAQSSGRSGARQPGLRFVEAGDGIPPVAPPLQPGNWSPRSS